MQTGEIGRGIAQRRKQMGLSQEELAGKIGVTRQAVSKWESGAALPSVDNIVELARVLGVSVDGLLSLTGGAKESDLTAQGVGRLLDEQAVRQEQRLKRLNRLLIAVSAVLLAGVVLSAVLSMRETRRIEQSMNERIASLNSQLGYRMSSIESNVANTVRSLLDEGSSLLTDGGCRSYEYIHGTQSLLLRVFAYPKELTGQEDAEFYAVLEDGTRVSARAEKVSAGFEADVIVPAGTGSWLPVSVYATWTGRDGKVTEKLHEENIYLTDLRVTVEGYFASLHYGRDGGLVIMPGVSIDIPYDRPEKYPVQVKYEVYADGALVGGAAQELSVDADSTYISVMPEEEIRLEGMIPIDSLMLRVLVTDAQGNVFADECVPTDDWSSADLNAMGAASVQ